MRALKDSEGRVRRELVIGLREPPTPVKVLVADITSLPEKPTGDSPIPLSLKTLFTFDAGSRQGVDFQLNSLEYLPEWKGFLIVTATEDKHNCFHGNVLWFLSDNEVPKKKPAKPRRLWLFGREPEGGVVASQGCGPETKAEGLAVLQADDSRARLVIVYDNDMRSTGKPSLLQTLTLARWRN